MPAPCARSKPKIAGMREAVALPAHDRLFLVNADITLVHHHNLLVSCGVQMELDLMSESNLDVVGNEDFAEVIPG